MAYICMCPGGGICLKGRQAGGKIESIILLHIRYALEITPSTLFHRLCSFLGMYSSPYSSL